MGESNLDKLLEMGGLESNPGQPIHQQGSVIECPIFPQMSYQSPVLDSSISNSPANVPVSGKLRSTVARRGIPSMRRSKNYPDTPDKQKIFGKDWETLEKDELLKKYETKWTTMRTWAVNFGYKRGDCFNPRIQLSNPMGGRPPAAVVAMREGIKKNVTQVTEAVRTMKEFKDDLEVQKLLVELEVSMHRLNNFQDLYNAQLLVVKLQGLASIKGSKTFSGLLDNMAKMTDKILLTRKVESETPMPQSLQFQYEQALGYWFTRIKEVASAAEWQIFESMVYEFARRIAKKDGVVISAQPLQGTSLVVPNVVDAIAVRGASSNV